LNCKKFVLTFNYRKFFFHKAMTKTTTKYGMFGVAAIVAILAVSVLATSLPTQEAAATHIAAKKGYVGSSTTAPITNNISGPQVVESFYIKSNTGGDWVLDLTAECAIVTHIQGKGNQKDKDTSGAQGNAQIWFEVEYAGTGTSVPVPISTDNPTNYKWNFCEQVFEIKTVLNDLIVVCTEEFAEDGSCTLGELVLLCEEDQAAADSQQCEQYVEMYLKTAGTHVAKALALDMPAGIHKVYVMAELNVGCSSDEGTGTLCDNFIAASAMIGKRVIIATDTHLLNDAGI